MKSKIKTLTVLCVLGFLSACAGFPPTSQILNGSPAVTGVTKEPLVDRLEKADLALREARLTDAELLYRQLTEDHPRLPEVWLRLGNIYVRQDQLEAAERIYTKGIRYQPQDARLWNNLALVQTRQAVQTLETSTQVLAPDDPHMARIQRFHESLIEAGQRSAAPKKAAVISQPPEARAINQILKPSNASLSQLENWDSSSETASADDGGGR